MRERLYWWALDRPILNYVVRDRPIYLRPKNYYVVRHHMFARYWCDPYGLKTNAGNPLSDWGKLSHAWRFSTEELAIGVLAEMNETGIIESYPYDDN